MTIIDLMVWASEIKLICRNKRQGLVRDWFEKAAELETDECIIWPFAKAQKGHGEIRIDGKKTSVHIEIAYRRFGVRPKGLLVTHWLCSNAPCLNYKHLAYRTPSDNEADKIVFGTDCRGSKSPTAKLLDDDIFEIRYLHYFKLMKGIEIALKYGVSRQRISIILNRKW